MQTNYAAEITMVGDKLRVNASVMKSFFSKTIHSITSYVKELLEDSRVRGISGILMVGGFSESKMLHHAIKSSFPNVNIMVHRDAGIVVLHGAVVFGHNQSSVKQRVYKYKSGVQTYIPFKEKIHDIWGRKVFDDVPCCDEVFYKLVEMGQSVSLNQTPKPIPYSSMKESDDSIIINIYVSSKMSPMYVTEEECLKIGVVQLCNHDRSLSVKERNFLVTMEFGETEIKVTAIEKRTGKFTTVKVSILG